MQTHFDYTFAKAKAAEFGFTWSDEVAAQVDKEFVALTLTQEQVDRLCFLHMYYMKWAFDPARMSMADRLKLSLWIMKGGAS